MHASLQRLADAVGVATEFWDWQGRHVEVSEQTLRSVLSALGHDLSDPDRALAEHQLAPWTRVLPPVLVMRAGAWRTVEVHVDHGWPVDIHLELESGESWGLDQVENWNEPRLVGERLVGEASFALKQDLPPGYHTIKATSGGDYAECTLIVTPNCLPVAPKAWGLATQLYSARSAGSWGVGDLADLADLAAWSADRHAAGFVLINPLHAAEPVAPMEPSPYLPTTRRFANPLYLRVERIPEYATLSTAQRDAVARLHQSLGAEAPDERIDRDLSWLAKRRALETVFAAPRSPGRALAFEAYRRREGTGLQAFATWCAIAEEHGPRWRAWPESLQVPHSPAVLEYAAAHAELVDLHCWLQWLLDEQLASTQATARQAGMSIGVLHDLAVGVHGQGAEAWALQDVFAQGVSVGAPPDAYSQTGQDWLQPPWRPDRLAATAYRPFRDMVSTVLRHAGGVRIDHVIGLFRLWWVPSGDSPTAGTYVRYDHEALIGILCLEASRSGAVVVGEDVGTVEPWMRDYLAQRGILGTSILFFERDFGGDGKPLPPQRWRTSCLASVTTHDLPPTSGYLAGDHVRLRAELGLLTRTEAEEFEAFEADREDWIECLQRLGYLEDSPVLATSEGVAEMTRALHAFLADTPSRLHCVALGDAVGDRRMQNQPGTVDEYPNWRVPLSGPDGRPLLLEEIFARPATATFLQHFRTAGPL